jgi:TctA family transporter
MIMLALFTPLIGNFALKFQSYEFFWLSIFGIVICGNLTAPKDPLKGWIAGFLGLFVAMVGMEASCPCAFCLWQRGTRRRHCADSCNGRSLRIC